MKTPTIRTIENWDGTIFEKDVLKCFKSLNDNFDDLRYIIYNNEDCVDESIEENNEEYINKIIRDSKPICDIEITAKSKKSIGYDMELNANEIEYNNVKMVLLTVDNEIDGLYFHKKDINIFSI